MWPLEDSMGLVVTILDSGCLYHLGIRGNKGGCSRVKGFWVSTE